MLANQLVDAYIDWLKSNTIVQNIGDYIAITTPFLDRYNDPLEIYVKRDENGYIITDDGYVINDLLMSNINFDNKKRMSILNQILNSFGITLDKNNALVTTATVDNFPIKKHFMIQAMLSISDMFMTSNPVVISIFYDEVENFLKSNDIRHVPNVQFTGKSGYVHNFDFVIPASKKSPERIIKTINNPNKNNTTSVLFSWSDTRENRTLSSKMYVFLNDTEKEVKPEIINAYIQYQIKPVLWSKRNDYIRDLSA